METSFRQHGSFVVKVLHALDCLVVALLLSILTLTYGISDMSPAAGQVSIGSIRSALTGTYGPEWEKYYCYLTAFSAILSYFIFYWFQLYRSWRGHSLYQEFLVILKAWGTVIAVLLFTAFLLKVAYAFSRVVVLAWFVWTPFAILLFHYLMRLVLKSLRRRGKDLRSAVIAGAGDLGVSIARQIEATPWAGITVAGFFDDHKRTEDIPDLGKPVLGTIDELAAYLESHAVNYLYITLPMRAERRILSILNGCRTLGVQIYLVPDLFLFRLFNATFETLGETLLLNFTPYNRAKRYFDIIFSLSVLILTLPLTLLVALAIKLQDGGPVFYAHERITATGKPFRCLKFRSMCVNAESKLQAILAENPEARKEWERCYKMKCDPRITPLGRILRVTSLDELPQFLNVLRGEMSVVGARPIVQSELELYYKEYGGLYCSMKPGITGPWQIGKRSDTESYEERVQLDSWYVRNHSFWLDIKIIFKTVSRIISGKGAY